MTAEDEFRKVGEDVRELARALRSELRAARQRARDQAREAHRRPPPWYGPYGPPRWDRPAESHPWWGPPAPGQAGFGGGPGPSDGRPPDGRPPDGRPPDGRPADAAPSDAAGAPAGGVAAPPAWRPNPYPTWSPRPPRPPRPRRHKPRTERPPVRHRRDGSTLVSILLVLVGLAWLGSQSGFFPISTEAVLAVVLALIGAAMVLTARTDWALSRRAWPVLVGAGVLALLLVNTNGGAIQERLSTLQFGPQDRTITTWADAAVPINNFAGPVTVDLVNLTPQSTDGNETLRINATAGPIDVTVPAHPGYHLHVRAHSAFGPVNIGPSRTGGGPFAERSADYSPGLRPMLEVDISSRAGPITVHVVGTP